MSKKNNDKPTTPDDALSAAKSIFTTLATSTVKKITPTTVPDQPGKSTVDTVVDMVKSNQGLITAAALQVLTKHPIGRVAGIVLATEEGQKLAGKAFEKATDVAGAALKTATEFATKTATETLAKKDKDKGPKAP